MKWKATTDTLYSSYRAERTLMSKEYLLLERSSIIFTRGGCCFFLLFEWACSELGYCGRRVLPLVAERIAHTQQSSCVPTLLVAFKFFRYTRLSSSQCVRYESFTLEVRHDSTLETKKRPPPQKSPPCSTGNCYNTKALPFQQNRLIGLKVVPFVSELVNFLRSGRLRHRRVLLP